MDSCKWVVATSLSDEDLRDKYGYELRQYEPYKIVSVKITEVFADYKRNDEKFAYRDRKLNALYGYEDGLTDNHRENDTSKDPLETVISKEDAARLDKLLGTLTNKQRLRLYMYVVDDLTTRQIAAVEGVSQPIISKSINAALKKLKKNVNDF